MLARVGGETGRRLALGLQPMTDVIPQKVGRWLNTNHKQPTPTWVSWTVVFLAAALLRQCCVWLLLAVG